MIPANSFLNYNKGFIDFLKVSIYEIIIKIYQILHRFMFGKLVYWHNICRHIPYVTYGRIRNNKTAIRIIRQLKRSNYVLVQEKLCTLLHCVVEWRNGVTNGSWRFKNFMVVSAFVSFVAKKMDLIIFFQKSQRIRFVPTAREHVKRNLAPNRKSQYVPKFLL